MLKDGHFSSDMHGPKSSLEPLPKRYFKLGVTWSWVHTMVLKANLVSRPALGGHRYLHGGAGDETHFMGACSVQCLTCYGIVYREVQPTKSFAGSPSSLLQFHRGDGFSFSPT